MGDYEGEEMPETEDGPRLRKAVKLFLTTFGIVCGIGGLLLSVLFYTTMLSAINGMQSSIDAQFDGATGMLSDTEAALASLEVTTASLPRISANLSDALYSLGNSTGTMASSVGAIADGIDSLPPIMGITGGDAIRRGAESMENASLSLSLAAESADGLELSSSRLSSQVALIRGDVSGVRASLAASRQSIDSSFGSLRLSALLISLMFAAAFIMLGFYSAAEFL